MESGPRARNENGRAGPDIRSAALPVGPVLNPRVTWV